MGVMVALWVEVYLGKASPVGSSIVSSGHLVQDRLKYGRRVGSSTTKFAAQFTIIGKSIPNSAAIAWWLRAPSLSRVGDIR